jgi:hypothetical protein
MNAKYLLYAKGNSTIDTLLQIPKELINGIMSTVDTPMIVPIPISPNYGEMEDNSNRLEYNPQPDDRLFVCAKIPKDDLSMWTTYCHIIAKHMTEVKTPNLQLKCIEDSIYAFLYQDEKNDEILKNVIEEFISTHDNENESLNMNNISMCELLNDYINHIYSTELSEEPSDFRHKYVRWTLLTPTETSQNTSIGALITVFAKMNGYKYGQHSDSHLRVYGIGELELPHEEIQNLDDHLENYVTSTMEQIEDQGNINLFVSKGSMMGFIWFCSESENNPFGYTEEESEHIKNAINNLIDSLDFEFPTVITTISKSPEKDPDSPKMVYAYGTTVSSVNRSLADGIEVLVERIYDLINEEEENE